MANIRPYDRGKCVLIERGMMRSKRVILRHVFYIGSSEMLYNNMNVLEFLMISTNRKMASALFLGLFSFALYFVVQTLQKSVLSDVVPEIIQASYFSTVYLYIHIAVAFNILYFIAYYV